MAFNVHLKQHTEMIHFDHEHKDATLRATELKPKLDRYMANPKDPHPRYQIRVIPKGTRKISTKPHSLYFGNQGKNPNKKYAVSHPEGVELRFETYFNAKLEAKIKEALPKCLALENFGTRQSKGFGSFYFDGKRANGWPPTIEEALKATGKNVYYFDVPTDLKPLKCIETLYRAMKGGINEIFGNNTKNEYLKSLLWQYFNKQHDSPNCYVWEKRFMKKKLMGRNENNGEYTRALLGITDEFKFKKTRPGAKMDLDCKDKSQFSLAADKTFSIKHKDKQIARFKSPITFKPVDQKVFIILRPDTYQENGIQLQGAAFTFQCGGISKDLKVPDPFDLKKFMDFVIKTVNGNNFSSFSGKSAERLKQIKIQSLYSFQENVLGVPG